MWEFHSSHDGPGHCWWWQYFLQGLPHRASRNFRNMQDALRDAEKLGFVMHVDRWQIMASMRKEEDLARRQRDVPQPA